MNPAALIGLFVIVTTGLLAGLAFQRRERARVDAVIAGRPAFTAQEFAAQHFSGASIPVAARCHELFAENYEYDASRILPDDKLCEDLLFAAHDGLDAYSFLRDIEREFGIKFSEGEAWDMRTMREIVEAVVAHMA